MRDFCTHFDHNYLARGLALYESLRERCAQFRLFVVCLSDACYDYLSQRLPPGMHVSHLAELEASDPQLLAARANRSQIEYYFTLTPCVPWYFLQRYPHIECLTYLDADLFFHSDPEPLFREIGDRSIALIPHRFSPHCAGLALYGAYNVGWLTFRRDFAGLECLGWYRERCLEWCYDRLEGERFADQKYLDALPARWREVTVLRHPGANLAPWNVDGSGIEMGRNGVLVDGEPLIFYHFHGLRRLVGPVYESGLARYRATMTSTLRRHVYEPYLAHLLRLERTMGDAFSDGADVLRWGHSGQWLPRLRRSLPRVTAAVRRTLALLWALRAGTWVVRRTRC